VSNDTFDQMVQQDAFVEWAPVHGNRYGTSKAAIEQRMSQGVDVLLEIDYQGALQVKRLFPSAVLIFVLPPSWTELRSRLEPDGSRVLGSTPEEFRAFLAADVEKWRQVVKATGAKPE
jgi:guanylate kinase